MLVCVFVVLGLIHMCAHICRGQSTALGVIAQMLSSLFLRNYCFSLAPEHQNSPDSLIFSARYPHGSACPCSAPPSIIALGLQICACHCGSPFDVGSGDGTQAGKHVAKPSLQPKERQTVSICLKILISITCQRKHQEKKSTMVYKKMDRESICFSVRKRNLFSCIM